MDQEEESPQRLTHLGRTFYHPNKCLNCDQNVTLLQHLLDPVTKMSTDYYVEVLSYIFGFQPNDTEALLLKLLNINEFTFCKQCSQLLSTLRAMRQKFFHQTKLNSYLHSVVMNKKRKQAPSPLQPTIIASTSSTGPAQGSKSERSGRKSTSQSPVQSKSSGKQVQPIHVIIDDEVEIVGQSNPVPPVRDARGDARSTSGAASLPATPSSSTSASQPLDRNARTNIRSQGKGVLERRYSVMQVILQALAASSTGMLSVKGIQHHIAKNYPMYDAGRQEWHDTLLAMLEKSEYFVAVRPEALNSFGTFWKLNPAYDSAKLIQDAFNKQALSTSSCTENELTTNISAFAATFPTSDLIITSVTSIVEDKSPQAAPVEVEPIVIEHEPTTSSGSTRMHSKKRTADETKAIDSSKTKRVHKEQRDVKSKSPPETILPDILSSLTNSGGDDENFSKHRTESEPEKARKANGTNGANECLIAGMERVNSPEFEIISSDDEVSVSENDSDGAKTAENLKSKISSEGNQKASKHHDKDLELITSDDEIETSEVKLKPETLPAAAQRSLTEQQLPKADSVQPTVPGVAKSPTDNISIRKEKTDTPELLADTTPGVEAVHSETKSGDQNKCIISLLGSGSLTVKNSVKTPLISIRSDLFEDMSPEPEPLKSTTDTETSSKLMSLAKFTRAVPVPVNINLGISSHAASTPSTITALVPSNPSIIVKVPKEVEYLKMRVNGILSTVRDKIQKITETLAFLQEKGDNIKPRYAASPNEQKSIEKEWWQLFVEIVKIIKSLTDIVQHSFRMLDEQMIRIRVLAISRKLLVDEVGKTHVEKITSSLPLDTLAKYFKIAIQTEDYMKLSDYKDFHLALRIMKYKVIRILKHFTPKDTVQKNVNEAYFYNICNYLKSKGKQNPEGEAGKNAQEGSASGENWPVHKAISIWDQVKLFRDAINTDVVNLDHNIQGVAGFENRLSKIWMGAQKRKQQLQPAAPK